LPVPSHDIGRVQIAVAFTDEAAALTSFEAGSSACADSPVSIDSSTLNAVALSSVASAGTRSPSRSSPG
jgi:hypothetical protein